MATELRLKSNCWWKQVLSGRSFPTVLNLGCGTDEDMEGGHYSHYFQADNVIRVDYENYPGLTYQARAEKLPLEDQSVDCVFANWMIYKTQIEQVFRELRRVCRPGAKLFISHAATRSEVQLLRKQALCHVDIEDAVTIPYRRPRGLKTRLADLYHGTLRDQPLTEPPEFFPFGDVESLALHLQSPVAMIVAHWDDEVVSAGGILLQYGTSWDVICVTRREHISEFRNVFDQVCHSCQANPVHLEIPHRQTAFQADRLSRQQFYEQSERTRLNHSSISAALEKQGIDFSRYQTIITHGLDGDVGRHQHHRQLARLIKAGSHSGQNLFGFSRSRRAGYETILSPAILARKQTLLNSYRDVGRMHFGDHWSPVPDRIDLHQPCERFVRLN